jgi:hypothetical protein
MSGDDNLSTVTELPANVRDAYERICNDPAFKRSEGSKKILRALLLLDPVRNYSALDIVAVLSTRPFKDLEDTEVEAKRVSLGQAMVRLRRLLRDYYAGAGKNDPSVIELDGFRAIIYNRSGMAPHTQETAGNDDSLKALEEFFGDGTLKRGGAIVLQSDPIEDLLGTLVPDLVREAAKLQGLPEPPVLTEEQLQTLAHGTIKPSTRFYKARTWINKWDTEGAQAIREEFQAHSINPPKLILSDHNLPDPIESPPFQISMGLGFTEQTDTILEICHPWMRVSRELESGDALSLHQKLRPKPHRPPSCLRLAESDEVDFFRILPCDWEPSTYLNRWLALRKHPNKKVWDYAMILRYTELRPNGERQVFFVVAGFTERGTAAAGHYLASQWEVLYEKLVKDEVHNKSLGDFLIVIAGISRPEKFGGWSEDQNFPAITPRTLYDKGIQCEWHDRFLTKPSA